MVIENLDEVVKMIESDDFTEEMANNILKLYEEG